MRRGRNHGSDFRTHSESADWCTEHEELIWECRCDQLPGIEDYAEELQRAFDDTR